MAIDKKLIDHLLTDYKKPEDIIGENGLLKELTKAILERALQAEMSEHLGLAASGEEVGHADPSLARGTEPLHDSVAGAHAGPGKGGIMNHRLLHRWAREELLPLPSRTHPHTQKQTLVIYTEKLTDLSDIQICNFALLQHSDFFF